MDWISTCAGSSWGVWTVETNTMPRAYDFAANGQYEPSILLTGEAAVKTSPQQVVTYHLNPRAVWSDGQPITSQDFQYTWDQIAHGQGIADPSGYNDIASVDDSDPVTVVVTFSQPYADWRKLFGGAYGLLPSHLLEGQDRHAMMANGYSWSGGPWELAPGDWVHGQSITLTPNPNYWGKKADLASVTFRIFTDQAAELAAYEAGEVAAVYPAPEPVVAGYRGLPQTSYSVTPSLDYDALWFNTAQAPVNDKAVREAIASVLDRSTLALLIAGAVEGVPPPSTTTTSAGTSVSTTSTTSTTVAGSAPRVSPLEGLLTPAAGDFSTTAFARYPAPSAVAGLMTAAGWSRGAGDLWTKGGQQATLTVKVPDTSPSLQAAASAMATELKAAGFDVTVTEEAPQVLFGQDLPAGNFAVALFGADVRAQLPSGTVESSGFPQILDDDPGQCPLFCSSAIPGSTNAGPAFNYGRLMDSTLDRYLVDLDANSNSVDRLSDASQAASILATDVPAIPIVTLPDVLVVNTAKVGVEGGTFNHNLGYGPFGYLNEWYLK
ncbi:MAG: ABC transporter substrate-binding protein [Acidimicrobiales bacterium]